MALKNAFYKHNLCVENDPVHTDVPYLPDSPDRSDLARGASG